MITAASESSPVMPSVGLGLWKIDRAQTAGLVHAAMRAGYRHLDSACDYGNEAEVGAGISAALTEKSCRRQELWVTSKLWNTFHRGEHVRPALQRTLNDLRLDYLDLYLVHFPIALAYVPPEVRYPPGWLGASPGWEDKMQPERVPLSETWQAMEELVAAGLTRHIGVCNYGVALLRDLLSYATVKPHALQVELHPYCAQEKLLRFCREEGIAVTGFSPLGAGSYVSLGMASPGESVLAEPVVVATADRHRKTPAQIVLRWALERGTSVVPKTSRPERLADNLDLFDFQLAPDEVAAITALDRRRRFNDPGEFCETAFQTFFPIYE